MRSRNMQRLTDQLHARYPGMTIYGIGDAAHKRSPSGHNEDDTPGSLPEDQDADSKPEHRAIDAMIRGAFTRAAAWALVTALVTLPVNRARLLYVIFEGWIWRRNGGWKREKYTGSNQHFDHPHVSGEADDDENTADWVLDIPAPQQVQRRGKRMFLIHKRSGGVVWFALVGETTFREWKHNELIKTAAGNVDGQSYANELAQLVGDSDEKTEIVYDAIKAMVTAQ